MHVSHLMARTVLLREPGRHNWCGTLNLDLLTINRHYVASTPQTQRPASYLQCGSCWAFAAIAAVESKYAIMYGKSFATTNIDFSEQQLVSCEPVSFGCEGGWSDRAMEYIQKNFVTTEALWPYTALKGTCNRAGSATTKFKITGSPGYTWVTSRSKEALLLVRSELERVYLRTQWCGGGGWLVGTLTCRAGTTLQCHMHTRAVRLKPSATHTQAVAKQPVVIYVCASTWGSYGGGIFQCPSSCSINHAVVAMGYDTSLKYWLIQNSWGTW
jgi:hypothetical protein